MRGARIKLASMKTHGCNRKDKLVKSNSRTNERWSEEDDRQLKDYYFRNFNYKGIAALLGRTVWAVKRRIAEINSKPKN